MSQLLYTALYPPNVRDHTFDGGHIFSIFLNLSGFGHIISGLVFTDYFKKEHSQLRLIRYRNIFWLHRCSLENTGRQRRRYSRNRRICQLGALDQFLGRLNNIFCSTDLNLNFITSIKLRSLEQSLGRLNKLFCPINLNLKFITMHP